MIGVFVLGDTGCFLLDTEPTDLGAQEEDEEEEELLETEDELELLQLPADSELVAETEAVTSAEKRLFSLTKFSTLRVLAGTPAFARLG